MHEDAIRGFHLSDYQLPDHRLLLFSQSLGSRGLSPNPFSLLPPDKGPLLLHGRVRHDHCRDSQKQPQVPAGARAAAADGDMLVTRNLPFSRLSRTLGSSEETLGEGWVQDNFVERWELLRLLDLKAPA